MSICKFCGNETGGSQFCQNCGAKVEEQPVAPQPIPVMPDPAYQQPVYDYQNGNVNNYGAPTAEGPTGAAKVFSIVSLICGIVSLITCCYSFIPGIPGLIFAIVAKAKYKGKNTMATLGMVFSIIGLVLGIIWAIIFIAMGVLGGTSDLSNYRYY